MKYSNKVKTYQAKNEGNPHDFAGYYAIEEGTTHSLVAKYLVDSSQGVVYSKPADKIAKAVNLLWSALTGLDSWRLEYIAKHMPEIFKLAQLYSDVYGSPNRSLIQDLDPSEFTRRQIRKVESFRAEDEGWT
jgi:hypothetical protein